MKIDEHVYKNKAISVTEAVAYIDEMTTCKILCSDDARSLQVIEKITRCMKAVIMENQQPLVGNNFFENTSKAMFTQNTCPSPTYSLPDQESNLLSQSTEVNEPTVSTLEKNAPEIETINICSDDEEVTSPQKVLVDVEIHRAMSNLSITNEILLGTPDDCSQSILNNLNFDGTHNFNDTEYLDGQNQAKIDKVLPNPNSAVENVKCPKFVIKTNKISETNSKPAKLVCPKVRFQNQNEIQDVVDLTENNVKNKKQRKRRNKGDHKKKNEISRKNIKMNKATAVTRKKKTGKEHKVSYQSSSTSAGAVDKLENKKIFQVTNVNSENNILLHEMNNQIKACQNSQIKMMNTVTNEINLKTVPKIYSPAVQNDLSWVENIRYVREIHADEFDSTLYCVDDAFWNNCAFPSEWNEQDFDYLL